MSLPDHHFGRRFSYKSVDVFRPKCRTFPPTQTHPKLWLSWKPSRTRPSPPICSIRTRLSDICRTSHSSVFSPQPSRTFRSIAQFCRPNFDHRRTSCRATEASPKYPKMSIFLLVFRGNSRSFSFELLRWESGRWAQAVQFRISDLRKCLPELASRQSWQSFLPWFRRSNLRWWSWSTRFRLCCSTFRCSEAQDKSTRDKSPWNKKKIMKNRRQDQLNLTNISIIVN